MRSVLTVVFVATMATGCVGEPDVSTRTQGVLEVNKITVNKITVNRVQLNKITVNKITVNKITVNGYALNEVAAGDLLSTEDGRELLSYAIQCAIPAGITIIGQHAGVTYEFGGDIGLAPRWLNRPLRVADQRWLSACLLARVNFFGVSVPISLRGPHASLKVTESEAEDFSVEEASFFGNIFTPLDEPVIWNACRGRDEATDESGDLDLRDCSEPDPQNPGKTLCGFNYAGDCGDWERPRNAYACRKFRRPQEHVLDEQGNPGTEIDPRDHRGGYYEQCHDEAGFGHWSHASRYSEVITVFVAP
jgi:hypothetical protein